MYTYIYIDIYIYDIHLDNLSYLDLLWCEGDASSWTLLGTAGRN